MDLWPDGRRYRFHKFHKAPTSACMEAHNNVHVWLFVTKQSTISLFIDPKKLKWDVKTVSVMILHLNGIYVNASLIYLWGPTRPQAHPHVMHGKKDTNVNMLKHFYCFVLLWADSLPPEMPCAALTMGSHGINYHLDHTAQTCHHLSVRWSSIDKDN